MTAKKTGKSKKSTDRKRTEEALRREHAMLARTEGIAHIGSWEWDIASDTVTWSDELFRIFQRDPREGAPSFAEHPAFYHPDDMARLRQAVEVAVAEGTPYELELRAIRKDGETRMCVARGIAEMSPGGRAVRLLGSLQDITERKRAEEALRESQAQFRIAQDMSPDGFTILHPIRDAQERVVDFTWVYENAAVARLNGTDPEAVVGKRLLELFPGHRGTAFLRAYQQVAESGEACDFEADYSGESMPTRTSFRIVVVPMAGDIAVLAQDITERRRAEAEKAELEAQLQTEEALREEQEFVRTLLDNVADGVVACNAEGTLVLFNRAAREWHGIDALALPPEEWGAHYDLYGPDGITPLPTEAIPLVRAFRGETVRGAEMTIVPKGQPPRHIRAAGGPFLDAQHNLLGAVVAMRDVTDRKRAEEALRESEARYRRITEGLTDYQYTVRVADGRAVETRQSPACTGVTGYTAEEYAVDPYLWIQMVLPEDRDRVREHARRILAGEDVPAIEHGIVRKDGAVRWVRDTAIALKDASGRLLSYDGVITDITERKRAEEALHAREVQLSVIHDNVYDVVFALRVEPHDRFRFTSVNRRFVESTGVPEDQIVGKLVQEVIPEPAHALVLGKYREAIRDRRPVHWEEVSVYPAGTLVGEVSVAPVFDANGDCTQLIGLVHDVTERKLAEEQLRQLQKAESLGRMAGAIAHHFNNQLGVVMGNLELALAGLSGDPRVRDKLVEAMQAARRSAEVSGQLLVYLGQTIGNREPLDLSETCRRGLPMLRALLPKHYTLETDLPFPGPTVSGNANRIQQVLTNLVANAAEAMGEAGGAVLVTVTTVSPDDIPAAHRFPTGWQPRDQAHACLEVRDAGCGIADTDMEKLFDPFFSSKFTGRGLGLPVVLGIVQALGGAVAVESDADRGSVFRVFIPLSAEEVSRRPEQTAQAPEMEAGGTVLLVEDEEMVRTMAAALLTYLGFSVLAAKDGVEAVEVFRQHQGEIRCVLCDLTMPRMGGWETLAALRKLAPGIPVVLASGYDEASVMAGDHPEQPQVFLPKPYQMAALKNALARAIGG